MAAECLQQPEKSMRGRVPVLLGMSPIFQVVMSGRLDLNQRLQAEEVALLWETAPPRMPICSPS